MELRNISFNEHLHRYTDEFFNEYKSVTTCINTYIPPFDKEYWSKYKAAQQGKTQEQILAEWDKTNKKSIDRGNKIHKDLEDGIKEAPIKSDEEEAKSNFIKLIPRVTTLNDFIDSPLKKEYPKIYAAILDMLQQGWVCYPEFRVYTSEHLIAGTIDCLLVKGGKIVTNDLGSMVIQDAEFKILDWKTNKDKLSFQSGYFKKKNGIKTEEFIRKLEYMMKPLDYIENCKGSIYTIQLSLYARILELWGNKCTGLALCHIRPRIEPRFFKIPYWKESCDIMLNDRISKLNLN